MTTRSSRRPRTDAARRHGVRVGAAALAAAALGAALSGCAVLAPETGDYLTGLPAAIEASPDLDVVRALAGSHLDGFARYVSVGIDQEHDDVSVDELRTALEIISEHVDQPGASEVRLSYLLWPDITPIDATAACEALGDSAFDCAGGNVRVGIDALRDFVAAQ